MSRITTIAMPIETSHFNAFAKNPTTANRMKIPTSTRRRVKKSMFHALKNYNSVLKYLTIIPTKLAKGKDPKLQILL
jgi:hypothetical protein